MEHKFLISSRAISVIVAGHGLVVVTGWLLHVRVFTTLYGLSPMGLDAGLAFLLTGSILAMRGLAAATARQVFIFRLGGCLLLAWGILSFLTYFIPGNFGIPQAGFLGPSLQLNFALFGLAMLIFHTDSVAWVGEALASLVGLAGLLAFTGYLYGVPGFYKLETHHSMALPMAVNFCLLSLAYLLSRPNLGFVAILASNTIAGAVARRLLPAAVFSPVMLGGLHLLAERYELFSSDFGTALLVLTFIVLFTGATVTIVPKIGRLERLSKMAEAEETRLETLRADASEILQHPFGTQELLQKIAELLVLRLDAAFARVWTLDVSGTTLELQASAGLYTHRDGAHSRVPVGQYKIGKIAQERRPLVTNQVLGDVRVHDQEWVRREGMVAFAGFPLMREDRLLGVVALFFRRKLSPTEIHVLDAISNLLAHALARKRAELEAAILREQLEEKVQERTAKLREAVQELEHFSYTITHDMRAPLRAMRGFGELLLKQCRDCMHPDSRELLRRISDSAIRMDHLITDALNYSRVVQEEFVTESVDALALLRGIIECYPQLQPPRAEILLEENIPKVMGNEAGLTQCFSNLLDNAVKFVAPGKIPQVRVWAERRGDVVRFWFEDNGIGIDPEYHDKIFGMFERLNQNYAGTGIGLALVRKVVERMGGKVGVESVAGTGSRFWVELKSVDQTVAEYGPTERSCTPATGYLI